MSYTDLHVKYSVCFILLLWLIFWCRLLTLGIQSSECITWAKALQSEHVIYHILWIVENTLNLQLIEKVTSFQLKEMPLIFNDQLSFWLVLVVIFCGSEYQSQRKWITLSCSCSDKDMKPTMELIDPLSNSF